VKLPAPYGCDWCPQRKGQTNHWWLLRRPSGPVGAPEFVLIPWDDMLADEKLHDGSPMFQHICSESCASKALSQHMARVGDPKIAQALRIEAEAGAGGGRVKAPFEVRVI
jgi:hypothetical protein